MKFFYIIFFSIFILISKVSFGGERYVCDVKSKHFCGKLGCNQSKLPTDNYRIIDENTKTYSIGKDTFSLDETTSSGIFKIFKTGSVSFMKIVTMDEKLTGMKRGEFIEVRDTLLVSIISHGRCKF